MIFLPPNSPMLATAELFFRMIKIKIRKQLYNQNVWFSNKRQIRDISWFRRMKEILN